MIDSIVYCKDCKYYLVDCSNDCIIERKCAERRCDKAVIPFPDDYDFCSKGEAVLQCYNCSTRFDTLPNYCPNCGVNLRDKGIPGTLNRESDRKPTIPQCNECKYYEGVHGVAGNAHCSYRNVGVLGKWSCHYFEPESKDAQ